MIKDGIKIAISGKSGCGNSTVSKLLAQTLGLRMINYTFRNMAEELGMNLKEILSLAEVDDSWDRNLDKKQVALASEGNCVLGSRLAIWVLEDADLKVFLTASTEVRATRIHKREGGDFIDVYQTTRQRDEHDRDRYIKLYGIDNDKYDFADLVIDTTDRQPVLVLEDIIYALRIKKLLG